MNSNNTPLVFTCGQAGFLAGKLEKLIQKCNLQEAYEKNLSKRVLGDKKFSYPLVVNDALHKALGYEPHLNAQYRLITAASILLANAPATFMPCLQEKIRIIDLIQFKEACVKESSFLQLSKDITYAAGYLCTEEKKQQALSNLHGMILIQKDMAKYSCDLSPDSEILQDQPQAYAPQLVVL